jgi:glutathione S-transferase
MQKITVTGLRAVPPFALGLVRDLRVRWALEEAGFAYDSDMVAVGEERDQPAYRARQPFGMVPAFEVDGLTLFESGAIVHRIAEESEALMPADRDGRSHVLAWMFAALNTVEPQCQALLAVDFQGAGEDWARQRRPAVIEVLNARLAVLADRLQGREYLLDRFTAADVLMTTVLRFLRHTDLVAGFPAVDAYLKRCEARPAFQRALAAQAADYAREAVAA